MGNPPVRIGRHRIAVGAVVRRTTAIDALLIPEIGVEVGVGEFDQTHLGVGHVIDIGRRGIHEPGDRVVPASGRQECRSVRVEQSGRPGSGLSDRQILQLQRHQSLLRFTQVHSCTGFDDPHLGRLLTRQRPAFLAPGDLNRTISSTETSFGVRDERQQCRISGDPLGGPQFGDRFLPFPGVVCRDTCGLADESDPASAPTRRSGVFEGEHRGLFEQSRHHHQMSGDAFRVRFVEREQIPTYGRVEITRRHVIG